MYNQNPKIALIIIGNEILSGRTDDKNIHYIANKLAPHGIELKEVRVVADAESQIIGAVNDLRKKYDYVFTTGGIGPTHDDITSGAIAKAFNLPLKQNRKAYEMLSDHYGAESLNPGRLKMAMVPENAELISNPVSAAPGFKVENVFVMAGVPEIMQAMLDSVIPFLRKGIEVKSVTLEVHSAESKIAGILGKTQDEHAGVEIGSYPYMVGEDYNRAGTNIVFRSVDAREINKALGALKKKLAELKIEYKVTA
jgi:molybdenum cofactor synthesis domain-containing protein